MYSQITVKVKKTITQHCTLNSAIILVSFILYYIKKYALKLNRSYSTAMSFIKKNHVRCLVCSIQLKTKSLQH